MLSLIRRYPYLLGFCILSAAASGPGQTYFISLIIPLLRADLELSRTAVAALYSIGTVLSACMVPLLGKALDRQPLRLVSGTAVLGVVAGLVTLGASTGASTLLAAFVLLRFFGQSGQSLQATTTAARHFSKQRGKALGITSIGWPLAEMALPFIIALLIKSLGWRYSLFAFAAIYGLTILASTQSLLMLTPTEAGSQRAVKQNKATRSWTVAEVFQDWRAYLFLATTFAPPFMLTGIFFHQGTLASLKGWSSAAIPTGFFAFGLCRGLSSLAVGPIIDRLTAKALFGFQLIPSLAASLILAYGNHPLTAVAAFGLFGLTIGLGGPIRGALWAEVYGVENLGAINGFGAAWAVFSTAISPFIFGVALDGGISWEGLMLSQFALAATCLVLGRIGSRAATPAAVQPASS
ncbi:MAG: hypothetical protein COB53_03760 [Elusimicrobia bacterium]|nr:MAG: hypothetical protein COB53_03760 [Elusimicrobiota bacterium]